MSPEKVGERNSFEEISTWLKSTGISYEVIDHSEIDGTASGSSITTGTMPDQGAKALIMTVSGKEMIMVVLRGPDKADFKAIKKTVDSNDVRLASREEISNITPIEVGTLHPFGNLLNIPTYVDSNLLDEAIIACGTGLTTKTITMKSEDYKKIVNPVIGSFVRH